MNRPRIAILAGVVCAGVAAGWITRSNAQEDRATSARANPESTEDTAQGSTAERAQKQGAANVYLDVYGSGSLQDPTSPDYDVMHLMSTTTAAPNDVFEAEPVDETWAPVQEAAIRFHLEKDILAMSPNVSITDIECRTATCKAAIEAPTQEENEELTGPYPSAVMSDGTYIGSCKDGLGGPSAEKGMSRVCFYLTYSEEHRDPDEYARWYKRHKKALFERIMDGVWCQEEGDLCEALAGDDHDEEDSE
tara:strand:+ start:3428 stop:4174 length:747 start_codon:yes stop_codon:yes gene_type:complete